MLHALTGRQRYHPNTRFFSPCNCQEQAPAKHQEGLLTLRLQPKNKQHILHSQVQLLTYKNSYNIYRPNYTQKNKTHLFFHGFRFGGWKLPQNKCPVYWSGLPVFSRISADPAWEFIPWGSTYQQLHFARVMIQSPKHGDCWPFDNRHPNDGYIKPYLKWLDDSTLLEINSWNINQHVRTIPLHHVKS